MHETPLASVSHKSEGRLRLKIAAKKKDSSYFDFLTEQLHSLSGIVSVQSNPLTGSVLLIHSSDPDQIMQMLTAGDIFRLDRTEKKAFTGTNLQGRVAETFEGIDLALRDVSGNELDLGGAAFLTLLALGMYQIMKGNVAAVPWYTAGWYAFNIFLKSNAGRTLP